MPSVTAGLGERTGDGDNNKRRWLQCFLYEKIIKIKSSGAQFVTPLSSNRCTAKSQPKNVSTKKKQVRKSNEVMKGCLLIRLRCHNLRWQSYVCLSSFTLTFRWDFLMVLTAFCANSYSEKHYEFFLFEEKRMLY